MDRELLTATPVKLYNIVNLYYSHHYNDIIIMQCKVIISANVDISCIFSRPGNLYILDVFVLFFYVPVKFSAMSHAFLG